MPHFGNNPRLDELRPLIWTLTPFRIEGSQLISESYDWNYYKFELAHTLRSLGLPWIFQPVVHSNLADIVEQIAAGAKTNPTVVLNLCDGYDRQGMPGLSCVRALEAAGLNFSGADGAFYSISESKLEMKRRFRAAGVPTADWAALPDEGDVQGVIESLGAPVLVKPAGSSASYGIGLKSVVSTNAQVAARRDELRQGEYKQWLDGDTIMAEQFLDGAEYTIFIGGDWRHPDSLWVLPPAERIFDESIPEAERFLSCDRYWGWYDEESAPAEGRPFYVHRSAPPDVAPVLEDLARRAYCAVEGRGYGRVDVRGDRCSGKLYVLEVNANCGVSGGTESSCGSILALAGIRYQDLIGRILDQAIS